MLNNYNRKSNLYSFINSKNIYKIIVFLFILYAFILFCISLKNKNINNNDNNDNNYNIKSNENLNHIYNSNFTENSKGWRDFSRYNRLEIYTVNEKSYLGLLESDDLPWAGIFQPVDLRESTQFLPYGYYEIRMDVDYINLNLDGNLNLMMKAFSKDYLQIDSYDDNYLFSIKQDSIALQNLPRLKDSNRKKEIIEFLKENKNDLHSMTSHATLVMYSKRPLNYITTYIYTEKNGVILIDKVSVTVKHVTEIIDQQPIVMNENGRTSEKYGGEFKFKDLMKQGVTREIQSFFKESLKSKQVDVKNDITIVGQLDVSRFDRLLECSIHWDGLISAVIYIKDKQKDMERLNEIIQNPLNQKALENIDLHLVYKNQNEKYYPVNELRNIAIQLSKTDYVFTIDIDFVVSSGAHEFIKNNIKSLNDPSNTMFVVAAFELDGYTMNNTSIYPENKNKLIELIDKDQARSIHKRISSVAHDATNYEKWVKSRDMYFTTYQDHWEPYGIFHKSVVPYDDRLAGYGWDKVSHTFQLNELAYKFIVLPEPFIIHLAHESTSWATRTVQDRIFIWSNWFESVTEFIFKYHPKLFSPEKMKLITTLNVDKFDTVWNEYKV